MKLYPKKPPAQAQRTEQKLEVYVAPCVSCTSTIHAFSAARGTGPGLRPTPLTEEPDKTCKTKLEISPKLILYYSDTE